MIPTLNFTSPPKLQLPPQIQIPRINTACMSWLSQQAAPNRPHPQAPHPQTHGAQPRPGPAAKINSITSTSFLIQTARHKIDRYILDEMQDIVGRIYRYIDRGGRRFVSVRLAQARPNKHRGGRRSTSMGLAQARPNNLT